MIKSAPKATKAEIIESLFMNREDFGVLVGLTPLAEKKLYEQIYKEITTEAQSRGLFLPDKFHLPTKMVLDKLAQYGFSKKSIIKKISIENEKKGEYEIE